MGSHGVGEAFLGGQERSRDLACQESKLPSRVQLGATANVAETF